VTGSLESPESLGTSAMVRSVPGEAGRHHAGVGDGLEGANLGRQVGADGGAARVGGGDGGQQPRHVGGGQAPGVTGGPGLGEDEGADEATGHPGHLLHPPDLSLLLSVGQLDHEAAAGPRHGHRPMELRDRALGGVSGGQLDKSASLAVSILISQDGALLDGAVVLEDVPDLVLGLLLAEHPHEQLPVLAPVGLVISGLHLQRSVHPWQCDLLVKGGLATVGALPGAVGQEGTTLVHSSKLVLKHRELVDLAKLLEHGSEVVILQVAGDLAHEQLDGVLVLLALDVFVSVELDLSEAGPCRGVDSGEAEADCGGDGEAGPDKAGDELRRRLSHQAGGREDALTGLQLRAGRDDLRGLVGHHHGSLGQVHRAGGHQHLQRGWRDGRTKMWKKFLFPLRKTSRFVVFVLYKLSKVPDVNLEEKKRKERNSHCRGDLKSIALGLLCS